MAQQFDYVGMRATADDLMKEFGMAAVLRREGSSPVDRPCIVAMIDFLPRDRSNALANPTDRRVLIAAGTPEVEAMPPNNELDQLVTFVQPPSDPPVEDEILPFAEPLKLYAPAGVSVLYQGTVRR
jgi:hypothetical protein